MWISDLGIAFDEEEPRLTATSEAVGPRFFMAPELEDGRIQRVDTRSDVYSLGKILYFLLTGGVRFAREKQRTREFHVERRGIDPRASLFAALIDRAIDAEPTQRFADAARFLHEFNHAMDSYASHSTTRMLASFGSAEEALTAPAERLVGEPPEVLEAILEHASRDTDAAVPLASMQAATSHLDHKGLFAAYCRCLLRWESALPTEALSRMARAAFMPPALGTSATMFLGIESEHRLLDLATADADPPVLNELLLAKPGVSWRFRALPWLAERIAKQLPLLHADAQRNFFVGTYKVSWSGKESVLSGLLRLDDDPLAFEAAVAGLCHCRTESALAAVLHVASDALPEPLLHALVRGIGLGADKETIGRLRSAVGKDTVLGVGLGILDRTVENDVLDGLG